MSQYIDGFVLSIPQDKLAAYTKLATRAGKIWREHGALEYRECAGDDMTAEHRSHRRLFSALRAGH